MPKLTSRPVSSPSTTISGTLTMKAAACDAATLAAADGSGIFMRVSSRVFSAAMPRVDGATRRMKPSATCAVNTRRSGMVSGTKPTSPQAAPR